MQRRHTRRHRPGWPVQARIARFSEPGLLLLLRDRPAHGYELIDSLAELIPEGRVDMGNLYRTLRALEARGLVDSEWDAEAPGPAKRRYELTAAGGKALDEWAANLEHVRDQVNEFLYRYENGRR